MTHEELKDAIEEIIYNHISEPISNIAHEIAEFVIKQELNK